MTEKKTKTDPKPQASASDPLDRIAVLESKIGDLLGVVEGKDAQIATLSRGLERAEQAEAARTKKERESYLVELQSEATSAGCAIEKEDMDAIRAAFERGDEQSAKTLGRFALRAAKAAAPEDGSGEQLGNATPGFSQEAADEVAEKAIEELNRRRKKRA